VDPIGCPLLEVSKVWLSEGEYPASIECRIRLNDFSVSSYEQMNIDVRYDAVNE